MLGMPLAGTQPLGLSSSAGKPKAMAGGVFFFGYFLLDKQKKVACRRATPDTKKPAIAGFFIYGLQLKSEMTSVRRL